MDYEEYLKKLDIMMGNLARLIKRSDFDKKEIKQNTHFHGADSTFTADLDADIKNLAAISGYDMGLKVVDGGKK